MQAMRAIPWQAPNEALWQQAAKVIAVLHTAGYQAVYAGGCVRDYLLAEPVADIDIASNAPPEAVEALFPQTVAVGKAFGVIIVVDAGRHFEVAQFRHDGPSSDGRHPDSVHPGNEVDDVQRRDFTINALLADPLAGEIRDHVQGLEDLEARCLRLVGDPQQRLQEDRLRILRAARFAARFACSIDAATEQALCHAPCEGLSRERIWAECDKVLGETWQAEWLELLRNWGHLGAVLPVAQIPPATAALLRGWWQEAPKVNALVAEVLLWQALMSQGLLAAKAFAQWYADQPLARGRKNTVSSMLQVLPQIITDLPAAPQRQRLLRQDYAPALAACLQAMQAASAADFAQGLAEENARGPIPQLLSAQELIAMGIPRGPQLGAALRSLEDAWLCGRIVDASQAQECIRQQCVDHR